MGYGGGVKTVKQIQQIIDLGVEKVAVSSAAVSTPELISDAAARVGSQSVVVVMDVKQNGLGSNRYEIVTHNGTRPTGLPPVELAKRAQALGAGEVVMNSIDQDGTMTGYDLYLIREVRESISLPLTALGGAGSLKDIAALIDSFGIIGAAAGSLFVFKGKYRAVLINYPSRADKMGLLGRRVY